MAQRRQGLSERRKAVGLTQEALAHRLGVERSTVVRWEAGDTEPLPSIRPNVARALRVSLDQLAELLTDSQHAGATQALPADTEVLLSEVAPPERPGRDELENLIRSQVAETVEVLRRTLQSAGVAPADIDALLLAGNASPAPLVTTQLNRPTEVAILPRTAIPLLALQRRRAPRFVLAGVLILVLTGGALSVPFIAAHSDPIPPAAQAPAIPVPHPDSNGPRGDDPTATLHPTPATVPSTPAEGPVSPGGTAMPAPHTIRSTKRTTSMAQSAAARTPTPPSTPTIPAEVYAWSQAAGLSASDPRRTPLHP
jgi:transcriptional regulator with XRE-family HTH domain